MKNDLNYPVNPVLINESKVRFIAFVVLALGTVYIATNYWYILVYLMIDFGLRAFNFGNFSLLALLADAILPLLKLKPKLVDRAPKRFSAAVGSVFCLFILLSLLFQWQTSARVLSIILLIFAFLDSVLGICAGCYVYTFLQKIRVV